MELANGYKKGTSEGTNNPANMKGPHRGSMGLKLRTSDDGCVKFKIKLKSSCLKQNFLSKRENFLSNEETIFFSWMILFGVNCRRYLYVKWSLRFCFVLFIYLFCLLQSYSHYREKNESQVNIQLTEK